MAAVRARVALPWLQGALAEAATNDALPPMPALRWLGGRGRLQSVASRDWREWLLEPVGGADLLARWPAGPALASLHGLAVAGAGNWCIAQPVHFATGLDHLRLAPLGQTQLTTADAGEFGTLVGSHFGVDELVVSEFIDGAWLVRFTRPVDCATQPPEAAVGHDVHDFLPAGPDGARIRSRMNEIQMLLHKHPVNQRRERARQLPVNAWWLWGFGTAVLDEPTDTVGRWRLYSDDRWLRAIWQGHGQDAVGIGDAAIAANEPLHGSTLIAGSLPVADRVEESLALLDAGLLTELAMQVRNATVHDLELLAGSASLRIAAGARFKFWRRPVELRQWLA